MNHPYWQLMSTWEHLMVYIANLQDRLAPNPENIPPSHSESRYVAIQINLCELIAEWIYRTCADYEDQVKEMQAEFNEEYVQ